MNVEVDYLESKNWEEQEMRERFRWLRENDPVFWSEKDQLWVITKYEDVVFCSKNQDLFTSAEGVLPGSPGKLGLIDEGEPRHGRWCMNRRLEAISGPGPVGARCRVCAGEAY